ncbi:MAG TPA: DNA repair protein RadC [Candidatus Saccharimonadales bacterium]|nr:DNA repair protein RadC [Candidatus Saccharimonadales bacterium]
MARRWPARVRDLPRAERPRELLLERGPAALSDLELVMLLLGTGVRGRGAAETAAELLRPGLGALPERGARELMQVAGVKGAKAARLLAGVELGRRLFAREDPDAPPTVSGPEDVVRLVRPIRRARKEHFVALFLNARHQVVKQETISIGTLNASLVHPREVFQPAVGESAAAVILAHNHPSGDPSPSEEDVQLTGRLVQAGRIMGIEVLDHVIVCANSYLSLKSRQWFE